MKQRIRNGSIERTNNKASNTHHLFFNKHAIISDLPFRTKKFSKNWYKLEKKEIILWTFQQKLVKPASYQVKNHRSPSHWVLGFFSHWKPLVVPPELMQNPHQMSNRTHFSRSMPVAGKISELFPHYWWSLGWFIYEMTSLFGWGWL